MTLQFVGVILVIVGCGGVGLGFASEYRREIRMLRQILKILNDMEWELQYHLTPLPELCRIAAADSEGAIRTVFALLHESLTYGKHPDVRTAMVTILDSVRMPVKICNHMRYLGASLGRYDLHGQIQGLRMVKAACRKDLDILEKGRTERIRGYQSLALCAGVAVAIILI